MRHRIVPFVAALCACSPGSGPAPAEPAPAGAAAALPELRIGAPVRSRLSADAEFVAYRLTAGAGDRLRLTMRSDSFDTVLDVGRMQDGEWQPVDSNDDAEGTNSRLSMVMADGGEYVVHARAYEAGMEGPFVLEVTSEADPSCCAVALGAAVDHPGMLEEEDRRAEDGARYDPYLLRGRAGEEWVVTMRSAAFAPRLRIGRWSAGALQELAAGSAEAGPPRTSRVVFRLPADGDYLVMASAGDAAGRGIYRILMERADAPR